MITAAVTLTLYAVIGIAIAATLRIGGRRDEFRLDDASLIFVAAFWLPLVVAVALLPDSRRS